jgi:hypothetical protein
MVKRKGSAEREKALERKKKSRENPNNQWFEKSVLM